VFQPLPGTVCTQLPPFPLGAFGPKKISTDPSAFFFSVAFWLLMLGKR
jgi:hypothetical protein